MKGKIGQTLSNTKRVISLILRCDAVEGLSYVVTQCAGSRKLTWIACTRCTIKDKMPTLTEMKTEEEN